MIDRRSFIIGMLGAAALPLSRARAAPRIGVVVDGVCGDARRYADACGLARAARRDAGALEIELVALDGLPCVGLGRDSQYFVLARLAAEHGYRAVYEGVHLYTDGVLDHRLRAARTALPRMISALREAGPDWPLVLAAAAPRLASTHALASAAHCRVALAAPPDSAGRLVSWCLARR